MKRIKEELAIPVFHAPDTFNEYELFKQRWLGATGSYKLFYALRWHAMFEALPHCDVAINIEKLSESQHYHANTISALKQLDLQGLDFSDCRVPMAAYGEEGEIFFREIEEQVHKIMTLLGYCQRTIERIRQMRFDNVPQLQKDACGPKETIRDAVRARSHARQYESELNSAKIAAARLQNTERRATDAEVRTRITEAEPHEEKLALNAIMPFTPGASLLLWAGP